jgi:hypothetical protein
MTVVVLGAIILLGVVAWQGGYLGGSPANLGQTSIPALSQTTTTTGVQDYKGNLNLSTETFDSLDSTNTGLGEDTELDTICYERIGDNVADWIELGVVSEAETGDANISVDGQTEMWCEVNLEASQEYYVDATKTVAKNQRIDTFIWEDADNDNDDTFIFRVNLLDITPSTDGEAIITLNWYVYDEETSDTVLDTTTASTGSISTGEANTVVQWNIDLDTSASGGDAKYLHSMRVRVNSTDDTDWVESDTIITLPDGMKLSLTDMDRTDLASTIEYKYQFPTGNDYGEAYLLKIEKDDSTEIDFPMTFRSAFEASDALCVELGFRYIDGYGSVSSYDTDDVELTVDSVGDECTL